MLYSPCHIVVALAPPTGSPDIAAGQAGDLDLARAHEPGQEAHRTGNQIAGHRLAQAEASLLSRELVGAAPGADHYGHALRVHLGLEGATIPAALVID